MYPINIRILGEEYRDKDFTGKDICLKRDIEIHFNKRDHSFSSHRFKGKSMQKVDKFISHVDGTLTPSRREIDPRVCCILTDFFFFFLSQKMMCIL